MTNTTPENSELKLLKEFKARTQGGKGNSVMVTKPIVDPESPQGKKLAALLKKGF